MSPVATRLCEERPGEHVDDGIALRRFGVVLERMRQGRLMLVLALVLSLCCVASPSARAESYGELRHFGSAGTGHGQFKLVGPPTKGTHAFGVDTSENAVYVGDEPKGKEYRVQKLTPSGGFVAATALFKPPNRFGIEGVAFDPALKRLYVLALEKRGELLAHDPLQPAAGTLYAFSTEASGEVLVPASGTVEGVLTGPTTFKSQSDVLGDALLKPKGIAVDPSTHDVIVMAELDEGSESSSFALQRIDAFSGALGARYVDHSGALTSDSNPNSPVVSPNGAVYVEQTEVAESVAQIVRIPSDFTSTQAPTTLVHFLTRDPHEAEGNAVVEFDNGNGESLEYGGGLSLSPEAGGDATVYAEARVFESLSSSEGGYYTGVLAFRDVEDREGFELGWTGGQSKQISESCTIGFAGEVPPTVAGGAAETVFMLDPKLSRVVEFGPGGSGCPVAEAGELTTSSGGAPVSGTIPAGTEVTLATTLTRANALSVEWSFGEGEAKPLVIDTDEFQHTKVTHKFEAGGELTVTETIHTDNLSTPTIVRTTKISVSANHRAPTAVISGPLEIAVGQPASFDGGASWDSNGAPGSSPIESYHWDFGDGDSVSSETPEVEHTYTHAGLYVAKLVVVDGYGLESDPSEIDVTVNVPLPPKHEEVTVLSTGGSGGTQAPLAPVGPTGPLTEEKARSGPPPLPDVRLKGTSLSVTTSGAVSLVIRCPSAESACVGTVSLRSVSALATVTAPSSNKPLKPAVLTFAQGAFTIAGGHQQSLALRLSSAARRLLARTGTLRARVRVDAHNTLGATHTTQATVTLRLTRSRNRK